MITKNRILFVLLFFTFFSTYLCISNEKCTCENDDMDDSTDLEEEVLTYDKTNVWEQIDHEEIFDFASNYKDFLNVAKTERESIKELVRLAEMNGFINSDIVFSSRRNDQILIPEEQIKFYSVFKEKALALGVLGKSDEISSGVNMIVSHVDSPNLHLKPKPIMEDSGFCLFKTHYYGGIRKYQWFSIPLAIHGRVITEKEEIIDFSIGEKDDEPIFTISDLLPHLANDQDILGSHSGEKMNVIVGSIPLDEKGAKMFVLDYLNKTFGIKEEDFLFAEIQFVPATKSRDVGFDKSLIAGYGHDDKSCVFTSSMALFNLKEQPEKTSLAFFFDKEEIGSTGTSSANTLFLTDFLSDLLTIKNNYKNERQIRKILMRSKVISADVINGVNPNFVEVNEMNNAAELGKGVSITKYTGSGGKYHSSDASTELLNYLRFIFNKDKVIYQFGLLGKIDQGGGGTIAKFFTEYGCDVIDIGLPVIGMHSPYEVISKADLYSAYKAYRSFYEN